MSKLPRIALISGLALSLASPIIVRAADSAAPPGAESIVGKGEPRPKKEKVQKPVTTPKRATSDLKDADQPQMTPQAKKERMQKPVTAPKRATSDLKDADQPQGEPATKPKR